MPVLQLLPIELLRHILSFLDTATLRKIVHVSQLLNNLAEPFLYARLGDNERWLLEDLFALVTRPELVRHVRRIELGLWYEHYPTPDNCALFSTKAEQLGIEDNGWWIDEQALLLLHLVPDVRELVFDKSPFLITFMENTLTTPIAALPFKSLVKFGCSQFSQYSPVTLTMLLALMRLPSLRHIAVDMQDSQFYTHDPSIVNRIAAFAGQSSTTHLLLQYGNTPTALLALILQMPRALTHFSYTDDWQYSYEADGTPVHTALASVRRTLQSLSFGRLDALFLSTPHTHVQTIGTFCDWPVLTALTCSLPGLLGAAAGSTLRLVDLLPLGLRRLQIRRKDKRMDCLKWPKCWTVEQLTEQLEEVLQKRQLDWLKVDTCAAVYREKTGWLNEFEDEVRRRLHAAVGTGLTRRCEIECS